MNIFEVVKKPGPQSTELMGLVSFLDGRAQDQNAARQIDQQAFVDLARDEGIMITRDQLPDLVSKPPLNSLLEPIKPGSVEPLTFRGVQEPGPTKMPVNKAQDIVAKAAKSAAKKDRGI